MADSSHPEYPTLDEIINANFDLSSHPFSEPVSSDGKSSQTFARPPQNPTAKGRSSDVSAPSFAKSNVPQAPKRTFQVATPSKAALPETRPRDVEKPRGPRLDMPGQAGSENPLPDFRFHTWAREIVALLIAIIAWVCAIAVLAHYDGRLISDGPSGITLAALVALLNMFVYAGLAIALGGGLGQLKWIHFESRRAPLDDMEIFDEASRGPWGSFKLIVSRRGGVFGTLGAVLSILALASAPFTQQIWTYEDHAIQIPTAATIPAAYTYTDFNPSSTSPNGYTASLPMKAAVYNGLYMDSTSHIFVPFDCQTGNCTWQSFNTLGICAQCQPVQSTSITTYCSPGTTGLAECGWQTPNGAKLNYSIDIFSMTAMTPSGGTNSLSELVTLTFMARVPAIAISSEGVQPWATTCSLFSCVKDVQDSVTEGSLSESTVTSVALSAFSSHGGPKFNMSNPAVLGIQSQLSTVLVTGSATLDTGLVRPSLTANSSDNAFSGQINFSNDVLESFFISYFANPSIGGILTRLNRIASAMTAAIRSSTSSTSAISPVSGVAHSTENAPTIVIRWAWMALPLTLIVFTIFWLSVVAYASHHLRIRLFKSSALALVFSSFEARADGVAKKLRSRSRLGRDGTSRREYVPGMPKLPEKAVLSLDSEQSSGVNTPGVRVVAMSAIRDGDGPAGASERRNHDEEEANMDPSSVQEKLDVQNELDELRSVQQRRPQGALSGWTSGAMTQLGTSAPGTGYASVISGSTAFSGTQSTRPLRQRGGTSSPYVGGEDEGGDALRLRDLMDSERAGEDEVPIAFREHQEMEGRRDRSGLVRIGGRVIGVVP